MNDFYRLIDELCIEKRITHRRLAELVGVNEVTLSRYLTGQRKLQLSPFMMMCKTFDVKAEDLYKTYVYACLEDRVAKYRKEHEKKNKGGDSEEVKK